MVASTPQLRLDVTDDDRIRGGDPEATLMLLYDWKDRLNRAFDQMARDMGDARTIRTADGSSLDRRLEAVDAKEQKFPESYPLVPVYLLGDYTDDFDLTDGLTGPFTGGMTAPAISADGILTFSGNGHVAQHRLADCGRIGGAFLPLNADWAVETAITALDNSNCGARGSIGVDDRSADPFAGEWYITTGRAVMGLNLTTGGVLQIYGKTDEGFPRTTKTYTPTTSQPVYLRMEYTHSNTTVVFKYKGDAESSWTTLASHDVGANYWSSEMDVFVIIDNGTADGTGAFRVDFDKLVVEYTPSNTGSHYAFIPTKAFGEYKQNHIYVKKSDGKTYLDIDPADAVIANSPLIVWDRNMGVFKRWNGTDYVRVYTLPALHSLKDTAVHTQDLPHDNIVGVTSDQHQLRLHDMDEPLDHNSPSIVADNFASGDAAGYPVRDSGKNATSFPELLHTHSGWSTYREYFLELV